MPHPRDDKGDRELFGHLAEGRREALGELYDRHAPALLRHGLALTRKQSEAEDLVHTVFVKLAGTGADLLGVRTPSGYLHRMLKTTWVDSRRRLTTGEAAAAHHNTMFGPSTIADADLAIDMARALDTLPALQREVVVLHLVEGFSFLEIGRMTGVSIFTAAGRYRLAINRLRRAGKEQA